MSLALFYAMDREAESLLAKLDGKLESTAAGVSFYTLSTGHTLCVGGIGKVNAALACQLLIDRFAPTVILNAGCAGALADLPVAQVVTATECVQYDVDTTGAGDPPGLVSTVNLVRFPCRPLALPGAMSGVVATGDWFAQAGPRARDIQARFDPLVCDMEACAAAQVCLRNGVDFAAVKSVSDRVFSPCQSEEYQRHFRGAMDSLDAAVLAAVKELEG